MVRRQTIAENTASPFSAHLDALSAIEPLTIRPDNAIIGATVDILPIVASFRSGRTHARFRFCSLQYDRKPDPSQ